MSFQSVQQNIPMDMQDVDLNMVGTNEVPQDKSIRSRNGSCPSFISSRGLCLFGYVLPLWVIVVILLLLGYVAYDRGLFSHGVRTSKVIDLSLSDINLNDDLFTPSVRNMFNLQSDRA